jgi:hypothetical protein
MAIHIPSTPGKSYMPRLLASPISMLTCSCFRTYLQYNIGDRIHISNVESETSGDGNWGKWLGHIHLAVLLSHRRCLTHFVSAWIINDVTLFYTTAVFAGTGEKATMSNGSLASSRVSFW